MTRYLPSGYEVKRFAGPITFGPGAPATESAYATKAATTVASEIEEERRALIAAERTIDPDDRAVVELAARWAAQELRVRPPRVRFFSPSSRFDFRAVLHKSHPDQVWISAGEPWYSQVRLALHETAHVAQLDGGDLGLETREHEAEEFARRHVGWAGEAARAIRSGGMS
jgi:hypothetical protein